LSVKEERLDRFPGPDFARRSTLIGRLIPKHRLHSAVSAKNQIFGELPELTPPNHQKQGFP
jgi:hypothetical protein